MMLPTVDEFIDDIENLVAEAEKLPKGAPPDPHIATTLGQMSVAADQQADHARHLGIPSALKVATQSHARVATAAKTQGWDALGKKHDGVIADLHNITKDTTPDRTKNKKAAKIKFGPQNPKDGGSLSQILQKSKKNGTSGGSKDVAALPVAPGTSPSAPSR